MAVIAVYSIKGGVGKTTIAVDLAWRWAVQGGCNTLLWDLDPQGGAGFLLGLDEPQLPRAVSVFQREGRPRQLIRRTMHSNLSLLQADDSLRSLSIQLARLGHGRRLQTLTAQLKAEYPRIVLDCPAGLNQVSEQVLSAADVVIVPLPASPLSARALDMLQAELKRNFHRHPPILPVLTMFDGRRKLHHEVAQGLGLGWPILPMASHIEQTAVRRAPLGSFAPNCEASHALQRMWVGIEAKLVELLQRSAGGVAVSVA